MTNPIFQVKNISVNGNEVEFDWGLKNGADFGMDMDYAYSSGRISNLPLSFNTALVKDVYVTVLTNELADATRGGGQPGRELTLGAVLNGVRQSYRVRSTATPMMYWYGGPNNIVYALRSGHSHAGWDTGDVQVLMAYGMYGAGSVDQDGNSYEHNYLYAKPFPVDSEGFGSFARYRVVLQDGESMPDYIDDLLYFMTEPASEHPDGYDPNNFPFPGDNWTSFQLGSQGADATGLWDQEGYSISGAGAGSSAGDSGGDSGGSTGAFFDITYGGQLSGVRVMAFQDLDSAGKLYCYATAEYGSSCLYFGTDLHDFASFGKRVILDENSQPLSLEGVPTALSMDPSDGSVYVGTITGKLYHVTYNSGDLNSVAKEVADGVERVKKAHWDLDRSECLFEVDGEIKSATVDGAGFNVQSRHSLVSGARVVSFESSPDGIAVVYRKQDYSFDRMFVEGTNWASPKQSADLVESVRTARSFVYNRRLQMWVAGFEDSSSTSIADLL